MLDYLIPVGIIALIINIGVVMHLALKSLSERR